MDIELSYVGPMALCALGIALNSTKLIMFYWRKVTSFDTLMISLAFCDLFICVSTLVRFASEICFQTGQDTLFSSLTYGTIVFSHFCALANTWIITVNRMVAVIFPLKNLVWMTKSRIIKTVIIFWTLSFLFMVGYIILQYYLSSAPLVSMVIAPIYALTFIVLLICYTMMFTRLKQTNHNTQRSFNGDHKSHNQALSAKRNLQEKKMLVLSFRIVTSFVICSMPYLVFASVFSGDPLSGYKGNNGLFFVTSVTLLTLNSVLDPLFYFHMQRQRGQKPRVQVHLNK